MMIELYECGDSLCDSMAVVMSTDFELAKRYIYHAFRYYLGCKDVAGQVKFTTPENNVRTIL